MIITVILAISTIIIIDLKKNLDAEMAAAVLGEFGSRGTVGWRLLGL